MPDFYSGIKTSDDTFMSREEAFRKLEEMGAKYAVVHFSGGHDEGGADSIYLYSRLVEKRSDEDWHSYLQRKEAAKIGELREHIWGYKEDEEANPVYEDYKDWRGETQQRRKPRPLTEAEQEEMRLAQTLTAPIYDKYYSFDGEFSVDGQVEWDVTERRVTIEGHESVEVYEAFEEDL